VPRIPKSVSGYYSSAPATHKETLLEMRERILEVVPGAKEIIKYAMPTFVADGIEVAGLMFHKNHIGYYPYSGSILKQFPEICAKYRTSTGALQVPIDKPLLKSEVRKLIKARIALEKEG
jgi:uncharacterized protein YdhG (YjbR/CyaY superfamily)